VLVHSTVGLATCRALAAAAQPRGVRVVDVAISGGRPRALDGTLALMVGGADEDVQECWPVLESLGRQIFHVGKLGAGMAAKLCNNLMAIANIEVAAEAVRLAAAAGIEPARMIEVGAAGTGDSWALRQGLGLREAARSAPVPSSQLLLQAKDLSLAEQLGRELRQDMPVARFFAQRASAT
jgi:3-hydroxyisobutyrate dehydrogenase-like beta-hydroxyacid dehydrogenase